MRASNTTPILVMRFEADTIEHLETLQNNWQKQLKLFKDAFNACI
jgi:phosphomannomutase